MTSSTELREFINQGIINQFVHTNLRSFLALHQHKMSTK